MERPAPYATYLEDIDILYIRLSDAEIARSGDLDLWPLAQHRLGG